MPWSQRAVHMFLGQVSASALLAASVLVGCAASHHDNLIVTAVREGDVAAVRSYIDRGGDVNARFLFNKTLLHHAIHKRRLAVAELLVEAGADLHAVDDQGCTPLEWVAMKGHVEEAQFLLDAGADPDHMAEGDFPLGGSEAPLHCAAWYGHADVAQLLLDAGADVDSRDHQGWTPLHQAAQWDRYEVAQLLIAAGAEIAASVCEGGTNPGYRPLHTAAGNRSSNVLLLLLDAGADPDAGDTRGQTPLHRAAQQGFTDIVEGLLGAGADLDKRDEDGHTPLLRGAGGSHAGVVQLLLQAGAKLDATTDSGQTALHMAAQHNNVELIDLLLAAGADPSVVDAEGRTPLDLAVEPGVFSTLLSQAGLSQPVSKRGERAATAPSATWAHTWGGVNTDHAYCVAVGYDGNAYVVGYTSSFGAGEKDCLLIKYDAAGSLLWAKTWGGNGNDAGESVSIDRQGSVYVGGTTNSFGAGDYDILVMKYDRHGKLLWQHTWGGSRREYHLGTLEDGHGSLYMTGVTQSFGAGRSDILLLKFDSEGKLLWQRAWGGESWEDGHSLAVDGRGDVYVAGLTGSFGQGSWDSLLLKYDRNGNLLWEVIWGGSEVDRSHGLAIDAYGHIYCGGTTESFGSGGRDFFLLKYDSNGNLKWARTWGGSGHENAQGVAIDPEGSVFIAGHTESFGFGRRDVALVKFDSSGALLLSKVWGTSVPTYEIARHIQVDTHSRTYITGWGRSADGRWADVEGDSLEPAGMTGLAAGAKIALNGVVTSPIGIATAPTGIEDIGGGGEDLLLIQGLE